MGHFPNGGTMPVPSVGKFNFVAKNRDISPICLATFQRDAEKM